MGMMREVLVRPIDGQSGRVDLNHRPPGPEAATKSTDVGQNVVLTRCSGQSESYLGSAEALRVHRDDAPPPIPRPSSASRKLASWRSYATRSCSPRARIGFAWVRRSGNRASEADQSPKNRRRDEGRPALHF